MGHEALVNGYKHILSTIYAPKPYFERVKVLLREYKPQVKIKGNYSPRYIWALLQSMWVLGIKEKGRVYYWRLFAWTLLKKPRFFSLSITLSIMGFHFRKVAEKIAKIPTPKAPRAPKIDDLNVGELEQTTT